ncbi:MAG: anthranilate synthase component I family protein [Elusimicrobia bacterium]|nr:anthranilate synthase component I family protein [Elusimicrobiota bacterium]
MPRPFSVVRVPLGLSGLDAASCLERLLSPGGTGFLIEKTEDGEKRAWIGVAPFETLVVEGGRAYALSGGRRRRLPGNPFAALGKRLSEFRARGGAAFDGGATGLLGYEMVRHLERVPARAERREAALGLYDRVVVLEGGRASLRALVRNAGERRRLKAEAKILAERLRGAAAVRVPPPSGKLLPATPRRGRAAFLRGVRRLKEHIRAGDVFQAVLSEGFDARLPGGPIAAYRRVRAANRAPYLFCLVDGARAVLGASPERLVRVRGGTAENCPIAGTRPRGRTRAQDLRLEKELRASEKERAEHLMLVDLARNDLGRIAAPGTVKVARFMRTRRFSNVMHLVSEVRAKLDAGKTPWDVLAASFPAGTVSGAPKVRALELLAGLERTPRGFYAGAVVQHDFSGSLDSCLALRTLELTGERARLQAGAGIVADSDPAFEWREVNHKLAGLRRALGGRA